MNFSFSLFLVSLSLLFVSCEKCSEALHETFKRDFVVGEKCDDCVILNPGISFRGENWAGFCTGYQLFLFRDWECRTDNELLNFTQPFAIVTNELCELVRRNRDLVEKCLKMFNNEKCNRRSDSEKHENQYKGNETHFFHLSKVPVNLGGQKSFERRHQSTVKIWTTSTETTPTSTPPTTTTSTPSTTTTSTPSTTTTSTPEIPTWSSPPSETSSLPSTTIGIITESPDFSSTTTSHSTVKKKTCEAKEEFFKDYCYFIKFYRQLLYGRPAFIFSGNARVEYLLGTNVDRIYNLYSRTRKHIFKFCLTYSPQYTKLCLVFFKWFKIYQKLRNENNNSNLTKEIISLNSINSTSSCRERHPKALGLAVESKEENYFVMDFLSKFHFYNKYVIFTSGIRMKDIADEWYGWNLKINRRILNLGQTEWLNLDDTLYYSIDICNRSWYLLNFRNSRPEINNSLIICKRHYNPRHVQLELHERCLELYRKSSCYNSEEHTNYCCEKDDTGEIWFACANTIEKKEYPSSISCYWKCNKEGFFVRDRPRCKGKNMCNASYNGISYNAATTRYAIGSCPNSCGYSTWYCSQNKTFLGTPDYSLCCNTSMQCRDTDTFLNIWMGCPRKKIVKRTACPSGMILDQAFVEWYCQSDGTFYGSTPDYSKCNISKIMCQKRDRFNIEWKAAVGTTARKKCPPQFTGECFWECKESGEFDGPEPDCSKCKADWMDKIAEKIKNKANHTHVMEIMENYTKNEDLTIGYSYILNLTADCITLFKNQTSGGTFIEFEKFLKSYSKILKNVAGNPNTWSNFSVPKRREYSGQILETTHSAAFANLRSGAGTGQKYNETFAKAEEDGFDFFVAYNPSVGSRFPLENIRESSWNLDIKNINDGHLNFAAMGLVTSYSLSSLMFPQGNNTKDLELNAPVITFTVATSRNGELVFDPNVTISVSFKHKNKTRLPETLVIKRRLHHGEQPSGVFKSTLCFYYRDSDWSNEGCFVTFTSKGRTNCTCQHLSTIALLMSIHKYEPNTTLEVVSTVSSGITIISLILALLIFYFFDTVTNDRVLIGKNLCCCLLVGHSLLVTVFDKKFFNITDSFCTASAILLHYVFMAAFAWMFVEGYHLYRMLVVVFDSGIEYRLIYLLIGYGMPLFVVGLTQIVGLIMKEQPYGQDEVCWLKPPTYIWAFVGPVIFLTSINVCILIIAMKQAMSSQRKTEKGNFATVMLWMKRWVSLSALLGVTWLFGLGYMNYNEPAVYVFIFFNGLQGFFILLFRCILCEQYKTVFLKKVKSWFSKYKPKGHQNVKFETRIFALSATKSITESKDSGCDPGTDIVEEKQKYLKEVDQISKKKNVEIKSRESSSGIASDITPAASEAYLRSRIIQAKNSSAKWQSEPDDFPELSYHDIPPSN